MDRDKYYIFYIRHVKYLHMCAFTGRGVSRIFSPGADSIFGGRIKNCMPPLKKICSLGITHKRGAEYLSMAKDILDFVSALLSFFQRGNITPYAPWLDSRHASVYRMKENFRKKYFYYHL